MGNEIFRRFPTLLAADVDKTRRPRCPRGSPTGLSGRFSVWTLVGPLEEVENLGVYFEGPLANTQRV